MKNCVFDTFTHHAAGAISRRSSLRLLGGAGLAGAFVAPAAGNAGKAGNKAKKRCQRQRGQCLNYFAEFCEPKDDPAGCLEDVRPCCGHFARCNAGAGIECFIETILA